MSKKPVAPHKYRSKYKLSAHALIPACLVVVIFGAIIWLNSLQKCRATDFSGASRHDQYYTALTTKSACAKAMAVCSYYSKDPKKCKIIE